MSTLKQVFTNIANAIREKTTKVDPITPENMAAEIHNYSWVKEYARASHYFLQNLFSFFRGNSIDNLISYDDTENVTSFVGMFTTCTNLTTIPLLNTSSATNLGSMFAYCSNLNTIPLLDTQNVINADFMFVYCTRLKTIPAMDFQKVKNLKNFAQNCQELEEINLININTDLDIHWSTKMQQPALHKLIDNLLPQVETKTLTMGATLLDRVSSEYKQKAKDKGWTLA